MTQVNRKKISSLFKDIKIGGTPSRGNPAFFGGNNLWVSIKDMEGQSIITKTLEKITDEGIEHSNCKLVKKGSLLFSFKLTVGRVSFAGQDLYTNEAIASFDPEEASQAGVDLEFLSIVLPISAQGDTSKNTMGIALLNKEKIFNLEIPLPEISKQKSIALTVKNQLAQVEMARKAINDQLNELNILRKVIMSKAFNI
ncbi:MAG: type I restriction endonuclease subunit S [Methylotenera sp.]|nr:type I restriction endonuclease subunit S [Methylotenera sp.]